MGVRPQLGNWPKEIQEMKMTIWVGLGGRGSRKISPPTHPHIFLK